MRTNRSLTCARGRAASGGARSGGALILSLIAVTAVTMLGASFLQLSAAISRRQEFSISTKRAFYLAEAGLAEAWAGLVSGKTGAVGSEASPAIFGQGLFWVEATTNPDGSRTLESTGMLGSGRATLEVVVDWPETVATAQGVFSDEPFDIDGGTLIDTYDSATGEYSGPDVHGEPALLQSNGAINVLGSRLQPTLVVGDLAPGPGQAATVHPHATLTGTATPADAFLEMPVVTAPAVTLEPGIVHGPGVPLLIPSGVQGLDSLRITGGSEAILQGPATLVVGDLTLDMLGKLTFDTTGGDIDLIITGQIVLAARSVVETTDFDATQVSVSVAGDVPVLLGAWGDFHGMVYAPEAQVDVASSFVLFGSVVARKLDLAPGAEIHFDRAVRSEAEDARRPVFVAWRVVEIPDTIAGRISSNPFDILGVVPALLNCPAEAHLDQALSIVYDDGFGVQVYTGAESGFDWTLVDTALTIVRDGARVL